MTDPIRIIVADDERPARAFLLSLLRSCDDVQVVGEAASGLDAVALIQDTRPDLALLDLQMPELDGLGVVRALRREVMPLVAFVTAFDEYAVQAFEANAVDYLLKPVEPVRLRAMLTRVHDRLDRADRAVESERIRQVASDMATGSSLNTGPHGYLLRVPARKHDAIVFIPASHIASIIADGDQLQVNTVHGEHYTIAYRLKELVPRLDPARFVQVSRGTVVNADAIRAVSPMPGGTYLITLVNKQQVTVSRMRARALRDDLLRL